MAASALGPLPERSWHVQVIPKDEAGKQLCLSRFRPFRLNALRMDPASFSSTLEREEAFGDEVWVSRLMSPQNRLIVAIDDLTQDIACAAFLRDLSAPSEPGEPPEPSSLLFGIYGLWTLPSARRRGIALAVLEHAKKLAADDAAASGRQGLLEVEAFEANADAVKLYEKAGFVASADIENGFVKLRLPLDGKKMSS